VLQFDVLAAEESVRLRHPRASPVPEAFVQTVCGLGRQHPLFADGAEVVAVTPL
jgi:hypothetical protein